MAEEPLVSVILPARDAGEYLDEAVRSILHQTHRHLELILVDDHGRDGSVDALDRDDPRLSIVPSRGEGVVAAFNTGLAIARGAYIARMDADDISLPERLARQVALFERQPETGIAGACVTLFPAQRVAGGYRAYEAWLNRVRSPEDIHRALFIESPIPNPTAMFRRVVIDALGGYSNCSWPEDYDLYLRADRAGVRMAKPEAVLLRWRLHARRLTHNDERYARRRFQAAKAHYLVHGRLPPGRPVLIWGAGPGGREMHDLLDAEGAAITGFVDVHPRRIGGSKRGLPVHAIEFAATQTDALVVVAVGARGARGEIRAFLQAAGRIEGEDYLFVA